MRFHTSFKGEAGKLEEISRYSTREFSVKEQEYELKDFIWDKYQNLIITTDINKTLIVETERMTVLYEMELEYII